MYEHEHEGVKVPRTSTRTSCSAYILGEIATCEKCNGEGTLPDFFAGLPYAKIRDVECRACGGTGRGEPSQERFAELQESIAEREETMCSDQEVVFRQWSFEEKFKSQLEYEKENVTDLFNDELPVSCLFSKIFH